MRTLKFRMWDDVLKVMYTPELDEEITDLWETPNFKGGVFEPREGIKMMQFTGKYDCEGTPIYEGDILENKTERENFDNRSGQYEYHIDTTITTDIVIFNEHWCSFDLTAGTEIGKLKIIGNIWQHLAT